MNFWTDHSIMFIVGLVVMPRMMLLFFGSIQPMSIPPILGFLFVPRMFLASILTSAYGDVNSTLIIICWILALVFDGIGFIIKLAMQGKMMEMQRDFFQERF